MRTEAKISRSCKLLVSDFERKEKHTEKFLSCARIWNARNEDTERKRKRERERERERERVLKKKYISR